MLIKVTNSLALDKAIEIANQKVGHGNLSVDYDFKRLAHDKQSWYHVRLKAKDSRHPGAKLTIRCDPTGKEHIRHTRSACWHAHEAFFDALPADAVIKAMNLTIKPGGEWRDYNVGSIMFPVYASESCECGW